MKAAVCSRYGPPEVVEIVDIDKPDPGENEVLIQVRAASVNPLDVGSLKGRPYSVRLMTGLRRPTNNRPGVDLAGEVQAVGSKITKFRSGDAVFGVCISDPQASGVAVWAHRQGAFAEYVCAPESTLVIKPPNITFEQAAAVPLAAFTALQGLRDHGHIQPEHKVLINGAAGGVGTFAVQIAKAFGAEVTGVCSSRNVDLVRSLGADHVFDYTREDFTKSGLRYDLIFDCVANHSLSECKRVLSPKGICVLVGDLTGRGMTAIVTRLITALILSQFVSQKLVVFLAKPNQPDLSLMRDLLKTGEVKPVIDRLYSLSEVPAAMRHLEGKHARGKIVVSLEEVIHAQL
jgi:NADPH:quinone reductase-like Zn-dependent oxidoreductase